MSTTDQTDLFPPEEAHRPPPNELQQQEPATVRECIEQYILERLNEKLEKLKPEQDEERQKLLEKYQPETWLEDAARRISQIHLSTHTPKQHHPDSKASAIFYATQHAPHNYLGSDASTTTTPDVTGNAANLDLFKLLRRKVKGIALLQRLLDKDSEFIESLSIDPASAKERFNSFFTFTQNPEKPLAHKHAKQVYFPTEQGDQLLVILYPSSQVHLAWQNIKADRFSDDAKDTRTKRFNNEAYEKESREYINVLTQTYGGNKPQNAGQLNSDRGGDMWLLPALPPAWKGNAIKAPQKTIFGPYLSNREEVRRILKRIINLYSPKKFRFTKVPFRVKIFPVAKKINRLYKNYYALNYRFRDLRNNEVEKLIDSLIDQALIAAADLQEALPQGWTKASRFNRDEAFWLDKGYRQYLFDKEDQTDTDGEKQLTEQETEWLKQYRARHWHAGVGNQFGSWLNRILENSANIQDLDGYEVRVWSIMFQDALAMLATGDA